MCLYLQNTIMLVSVLLSGIKKECGFYCILQNVPTCLEGVVEFACKIRCKLYGKTNRPVSFVLCA